MQAIQVKYLPATDTKPTRMKAWSYSGKSITVPVNGEHDAVARTLVLALLKALDWHGAWIGGVLPNQDYAFICFEKNCPPMAAIS